MTNNERNARQTGLIKLGPEKLKTYFLSHLNKIYCAKSLLASRLPEIGMQSHFIDLKHAIFETAQDVDNQIARMEEIFTLLDAETSSQSCVGIPGLLEEAFEAIHGQRGDPVLSDLSILFYMQNIESLEMASFQVLRIAAVKLKNKQIKQLLLENFDESKADRALFLLITAKYMTC
jgi:ferritin-like metal-binding protein YciE